MRREQAQRLERFLLGPGCGNAQRSAQPDVLRHDRVDECVERIVPERREHPGLVLSGRADVSLLKQIAPNIHLTGVCRLPLVSKSSRLTPCPPDAGIPPAPPYCGPTQ